MSAPEKIIIPGGSSPVADKKPGSISAIFNKDIKFRKEHLNDNRKEKFFRELFILSSSGLDLKSSLEIIEEQQTQKKVKEIITNLRNKVIHGSSFSEAMKASNEFSSYEYNSIRIGEESGKLEIVLEELSKYTLRKIKQRRQFIQTISYPSIVFSISILVIVFMMVYVVPMFNEVFKRFNSDLPLITKIIISASTKISSVFLPVFLLFTGLIVLFIYQRKTERVRRITGPLILKIPIFGEIIRKIYLTRFCSAMYLLLSSETPLITSLELVKQMIRFYPIENSIDFIKQEVINGKSLNHTMAQFPVYPKSFIGLVKVGEEVNKLDNIFKSLADEYSSEVDHKISLLSTFMEPLIIVFLGVFIGVILVAMYLPLFKLSSTLSF